MFVLSQRENGFPLNFDQMKNLPQFLTNFVSFISNATTLEKFLKYFGMLNNPFPEYSDRVDWFQRTDKGRMERINKFHFYKIPLIGIDGKFSRFIGEIKGIGKNGIPNILSSVICSDLGTSVYVAVQSLRHAFYQMDSVEKILLSIDKRKYSGFRIDFNKSRGTFMASCESKTENYRLMFSGSYESQAAQNFYIEYKGFIFRIGRTNRHTLNHTTKQLEQLREIEKYIPIVSERFENMLSEMSEISGTFNEFYSRIFKVKTTELSGRALGLYREISDEYEKISPSDKGTLKGFYLACLGKDKLKNESDKISPLVGSHKQYSLEVSKYAEKNFRIRKFSDV